MPACLAGAFQGVLVEVAVRQAGLELVVVLLQRGALAGLVVHHFVAHAAPELVEVLPVFVKCQRLQMFILAATILLSYLLMRFRSSLSPSHDEIAQKLLGLALPFEPFHRMEEAFGMGYDVD